MSQYVKRNICGVNLEVNVNASNKILFEEVYANEIKSFDIETIKNYFYAKNEGYIPVLANWELTSCCNFNCPFCYINQKTIKKQMYTFEEAKLIIDTMVNEGLLFCNLTGGEVFLNPDFLNIYKYLKNKGVIVSIFTNLSLLTDEILDVLVEYKPYIVEVSIYGYSDKQFCRVTNLDGCVKDKVFKNINKLLDNNIRVRCKTPITTLTETDIDLIHEYCNNIGIDYYVSPEIVEGYDGNNNDEYKVIGNNKISADNSYSIDNFHSNPKFAFDCSAGKSSVYISYDKCIYPCMSSFGIKELCAPIFDKNKNINDFIGEMKKILEKYESKPICKGCNKHETCTYCIVKNIKKIKPDCRKDLNLPDYGV